MATEPTKHPGSKRGRSRAAKATPADERRPLTPAEAEALRRDKRERCARIKALVEEHYSKVRKEDGE